MRWVSSYCTVKPTYCIINNIKVGSNPVYKGAKTKGGTGILIFEIGFIEMFLRMLQRRKESEY